ncbi:Cytosolic carboxypeptidase-like protein 5 [Paramecium bursaria]
MDQLCPSQIIEQFGSIKFSSCFDSGNLGSVRKESTNKFLLTIQCDSSNNKQTNYRTWFYFSVEGVDDDTILTFVILNMQNQFGLFREGMQPVYRGNNEWQRIKLPCQYRLLPEGPFELTFRHHFTSQQKIYFAFSYPWSYQESEFLTKQLEDQSKNLQDIYFKNNTLMYSKEGRKITLLTITTNNNQLKYEEPIQSLFPIPSEGRPMCFKKKYIFVSARVHPGEVPGSFVLNGLLKYLLDQNDVGAQIARDQFVWVIVPVINPDGVQRGHYRTDSFCQNLNRFYINPSLSDQPEIYAIKEYVMRLHNTDRMYAYIDLHAHAGHKGIFIYGNQLPTLSGHTQNCLYPKLLTLYSEIFDYDGCNFTEKNMYAADKGDGLSKEGSGRVALYKATNIVHSYTLECNYNTGKIINILSTEQSLPMNKQEILQTYGSDQVDENIILNPTPALTNQQTYFYTISDYENVGRALVLAFLDINLVNPISKIPDSYFKTLSNLKSFLGYNILKTMHFRFDNYLRKILKNINNKEQIPRTVKAFYDYLLAGQMKDNLEGEQQQKPMTRYQKAQELKKSKQNLQPLKLTKKELSGSVAPEVQQIQQQTQTNKQQLIMKEQKFPSKQYAHSAIDLDEQVLFQKLLQGKSTSQAKSRAQSEGKNSILQQRVVRSFKIKRSTK